jgi:hypothetical protein
MQYLATVRAPRHCAPASRVLASVEHSEPQNAGSVAVTLLMIKDEMRSVPKPDRASVTAQSRGVNYCNASQANTLRSFFYSSKKVIL